MALLSQTQLKFCVLYILYSHLNEFAVTSTLIVSSLFWPIYEKRPHSSSFANVQQLFYHLFLLRNYTATNKTHFRCSTCACNGVGLAERTFKWSGSTFLWVFGCKICGIANWWKSLQSKFIHFNCIVHRNPSTFTVVLFLKFRHRFQLNDGVAFVLLNIIHRFAR